jgi:FAD/FMN-containing dehydrogenase
MTGISLVQHADDGLLRLAVYFRDEIVRGLFLDGDDVQVAARTDDEVAGAARSLHGCVQHRVHKFSDE